jgi:hypothetical protein
MISLITYLVFLRCVLIINETFHKLSLRLDLHYKENRQATLNK